MEIKNLEILTEMKKNNLNNTNSGILYLTQKFRGEEPTDWELNVTETTTSRIANIFIIIGKAGTFPLNLEYNVDTKGLVLTLTINNYPIIWNHTVDDRWRVISDDTTLFISWLQIVGATNSRPEYRFLTNSRLLFKVN